MSSQNLTQQDQIILTDDEKKVLKNVAKMNKAYKKIKDKKKYVKKTVKHNLLWIILGGFLLYYLYKSCYPTTRSRCSQQSLFLVGGDSKLGAPNFDNPLPGFGMDANFSTESFVGGFFSSLFS